MNVKILKTVDEYLECSEIGNAWIKDCKKTGRWILIYNFNMSEAIIPEGLYYALKKRGIIQ